MASDPIKVADVLSVAGELTWLGEPPVFFGASIVPLYLDDQAVREDRTYATRDVDVIVHLPAADPDGRKMESALIAHGWKHDLRPARRNQHAFVSAAGIPVDVVMDGLYSDEDWAIRAAGEAEQIEVDSEILKVPSPAWFVATKISASENPERWEGSYLSHDLEDALSVMLGCTRFASDLRCSKLLLRNYLGGWSSDVLAAHAADPYGTKDRLFPALEASLPRGFVEQDLRELLAVIAAQDE